MIVHICGGDQAGLEPETYESEDWCPCHKSPRCPSRAWEGL